jgi:hypothetical protein
VCEELIEEKGELIEAGKYTGIIFNLATTWELLKGGVLKEVIR